MKLSHWKQLKVREDLVISTQNQQGNLVYVVKDPISLRYFRLLPTEYAITKMLDGHTPIDQVKERLQELGHEISDEELQAFLQQLGAANFFENVLPNQSESLYRLAVLRRKHKSLWTQIKRILFVKIPLYDPDRFFGRVMPWIRFLWSRAALMAYGVLFAWAVIIFVSNFGKAASGFSDLLTAENLLAFWIIFIAVKTLHELGHGFTCKYFGGEVHELGILVLVLTPCLYCNITDAWIQEKHSRKFYISAAGIITELIIASIAAIVWWASDPGVVRAISYRIMVLAGISSVLFNGNPLMRFDGYYILSDVLGMPNLRSSSVQYVRLFFRKYILGLEAPGASIFSRENAIKLLYGSASSIWIFYVMYRIVRGLIGRIPPLGAWILITTVYGLVLVPVVRIASAIAKRRGKPANVNLGRIATISAVLAAVGYFTFFYDMGYSVTAPCVVQAAERRLIYAPTAGVLREVPFKEGEAVAEDAVIARLENRQLELALEEMKHLVESRQLQADYANSTGDAATRDYHLDAKRELVLRIGETEKRIEDLVVRAPFAGIIIAPPERTLIGRYIPRGGLLMEVADVSTAKVTVALTEKDLAYVTEKAPTRITLRAYPWSPFEGAVVSISIAPRRYLPEPALSDRAGGGVQTKPDVRHAIVALDTTFEVQINLANDDPLRPLMPGMAGRAKIAYGEGRRFWEIIYMKVRQNIRRSFGV